MKISPTSSDPLKVGPVKVAPRLILAPMSGVTTTAFRRLIRQENPDAVGLMVTEFISVEGLTRQNRQSLQMMAFHPEERPLSIQIFGHDIQRMVDAAIMAEQAGADIVDINSGCPVPKVVRRGGGCELMRQPDHLQQILGAICKAVSIPVTLKIRSGWDASSRNAPEVALRAQDAGVAMVAVHGRTRKDLYRGLADWDLIGEVARGLSIPVVGSGDIVNRETAEHALACGVAGLMIGRGALSNPWIFKELSAYSRGETYERPADIETPRILLKYLALLREILPDKAVIGRMKQFASQVTRRVRGAASLRRALCMCKTVDEFESLLRRWEEYLLTGSPDLLDATLRSNLDEGFVTHEGPI